LTPKHSARLDSQVPTCENYLYRDPKSGVLLEKAMERFGLNARAHARILKIARTIADLEESPDIGSLHVAEAIQYCSLDRKVLR